MKRIDVVSARGLAALIEYNIAADQKIAKNAVRSSDWKAGVLWATENVLACIDQGRNRDMEPNIHEWILDLLEQYDDAA